MKKPVTLWVCQSVVLSAILVVGCERDSDNADDGTDGNTNSDALLEEVTDVLQEPEPEPVPAKKDSGGKTPAVPAVDPLSLTPQAQVWTNVGPCTATAQGGAQPYSSTVDVQVVTGTGVVDVVIDVDTGVITFTPGPLTNAAVIYTVSDDDGNQIQGTITFAFGGGGAPATPPRVTRLTVDSLTYTVDGTNMLADAAPYITAGNVTMVPALTLAVAFDMGPGAVTWDGVSRTITMTKGGTVFSMVIGQTKYTVNGIEYPSSAEAVIKDGRTFLPVVSAVTAFGANLTWDAATRTMVITY